MTGRGRDLEVSYSPFVECDVFFVIAKGEIRKRIFAYAATIGTAYAERGVETLNSLTVYPNLNS